MAFQYDALNKLDAKQKMFEFALEAIRKGHGISLNPSSFEIDFRNRPNSDSGVFFSFRKMVTDFNSVSPSSKYTSLSVVDALYHIAVTAVQRKEFVYAAAAFREIIQTIKNHSQDTAISLPVPAFLLFRQFVSTLIRAQAYEEARKTCEHLLACDPTDVLTMLELSDVFVCTNSHLDKAEKILGEALDILLHSEKSEFQTHFGDSLDIEEEEGNEREMKFHQKQFSRRNPKRIKITHNTKRPLFKSFQFKSTKITSQPYNQYFFDPIQRREVKVSVKLFHFFFPNIFFFSKKRFDC